MYVIRGDRPLVIILPPKTATRTYHKLMMSIRDRVERIGNRHSVQQDRLKQHIAAGDPIFMSVRHPCDLLVSWYHYTTNGRDRPEPFGIYLAGFLEIGNVPWVEPTGRLFYAAEHANGVLRYERGPVAEMRRACATVGVELPEQEEPIIGKAENRQPWRAYYTTAMLHQTYDRFESDFLDYGYTI